MRIPFLIRPISRTRKDRARPDFRTSAGQHSAGDTEDQEDQQHLNYVVVSLARVHVLYCSIFLRKQERAEATHT